MSCEYLNRQGVKCEKLANKIGTSGKWDGCRLCNTHFSSTRKKSSKDEAVTEQPTATCVVTADSSHTPTPLNTPETNPVDAPEITSLDSIDTEYITDENDNKISNVDAPFNPDDIEIDPRVKKLFDIPNHEQRSNEWYQLRRQRLTASDVATAIGMNPYSSRADLIYKKCGGKDTFKGNAATKHGEKWEDTAIRMYCEKYKDKSFDFGLLPHHTIPFLGGSPDGITAKGTVLEVKCPLMRKIEPGVVPAYYLPQVQIVMECTNLDMAHFIQYKPPPNEVFDVTVVPRDRDWFARYFPVMDFFWREVLHYREIGLPYNPVHIKKEQAEKDKENKTKKIAGPAKLDTSKYMFQDDE